MCSEAPTEDFLERPERRCGAHRRPAARTLLDALREKVSMNQIRSLTGRSVIGDGGRKNARERRGRRRVEYSFGVPRDRQHGLIGARCKIVINRSFRPHRAR